MLKHHIRAFPFLYYLKSMVTCKNMKSKWIVVVLYGGKHITSISNKISLKAMYDPKVIYIVAWHIMHVFNCYCIKQTTNTSWKLPSVLICAHRLIHHQVLAKRFMNVVYFLLIQAYYLFISMSAMRRSLSLIKVHFHEVGLRVLDKHM